MVQQHENGNKPRGQRYTANVGERRWLKQNKWIGWTLSIYQYSSILFLHLSIMFYYSFIYYFIIIYLLIKINIFLDSFMIILLFYSWVMQIAIVCDVSVWMGWFILLLCLSVSFTHKHASTHIHTHVLILICAVCCCCCCCSCYQRFSNCSYFWFYNTFKFQAHWYLRFLVVLYSYYFHYSFNFFKMIWLWYFKFFFL